jgi:hypothetical protein
MTWVVMFCWASFCRPDPAEPRAFDSIDECREVVHPTLRSIASKSRSGGGHDGPSGFVKLVQPAF